MFLLSVLQVLLIYVQKLSSFFHERFYILSFNVFYFKLLNNKTFSKQVVFELVKVLVEPSRLYFRALLCIGSMVESPLRRTTYEVAHLLAGNF